MFITNPSHIIIVTDIICSAQKLCSPQGVVYFRLFDYGEENNVIVF